MHRHHTKLIVRGDYDRYFKGLVNGWLENILTCYFDKIIITAGPYRAYAVSYKVMGKDLHLDFYSALRTGFGQLTKDDIDAIKRLMEHGPKNYDPSITGKD